jgi:hypothetical protein
MVNLWDNVLSPLLSRSIVEGDKEIAIDVIDVMAWYRYMQAPFAYRKVGLPSGGVRQSETHSHET